MTREDKAIGSCNANKPRDHTVYGIVILNVIICVFVIKVVRPKFTQKIPPKELN